MQFLTWTNRWKQRDSFKLELAAVIALKVSFLYLLWHLCFSDPLGDHLNDQKLARHIVTSALPLPNTRPKSPAVVD